MDTRPIPAFYCCYLLRSTVRHSSLYVGSTPHPVRRLAQHNGQSRGGAVRTSRESLRPWEMTCIVTGFGSHIAALQFEWAWQNGHLTRHIPDEQRLTEARSRTGRRRKVPARPRLGLTEQLANLHLLLRVDSFRSWPLQVRFFCADVYRIWQRWTERAGATLREGLDVTLDDDPEVGGIARLDIGYAPVKTHLQKSLRLEQASSKPKCAVCGKLVQKEALLATCPRETCESTSHLTCLADHFLSGKRDGPEEILPTEGDCPSCKSSTRWIDVVKELTLRTRGEKEVAKLLKEPRVKKTKAQKGKGTNQAAAPNVDGTEDSCSSHSEDEIRGNPEHEWRYVDEDEDDVMSVASTASETSHFSARASRPAPMVRKKGLDTVIEDTDWDEAEVLD
ncbi:MAG: RNA polymerase B [Watsoniomyces obsoletus]|nr:MAG: RNA polymerase B [Watsoniomyces obsoletus]